MQPLIGIPLCLDERGRWRPGRDYVYADRAYAAAVEAAGATPLHLPTPGRIDAERMRTILHRLDGVLIPGGDDFPPDDPTAYPEAVFDLAPAAQRAFDRSLLEATLLAGKPLLGICYGMQLLALHAGGALHPHLPNDIGDAIDHGGGGRASTEHSVEIESGTLLERVVGLARSSVNSRHHQGVRDAGSLTVSARSSDGLIEGIEHPDSAFVAGVQWHPEVLDGNAGAGLIAAFVEAARAVAAER